MIISGFFCFFGFHKGEPPKTGTATMRVYTKNKNDEEPKFSQQVYTPNVDENAGPNTLVTTVVASDKDGDNVRYVVMTRWECHCQYFVMFGFKLAMLLRFITFSRCPFLEKLDFFFTYSSVVLNFL